MKTWNVFIELVRDLDHSFYANVYKDGKPVEGLPRKVSYQAIRKAILKETGFQIPDKKDVLFETYRAHHPQHQLHVMLLNLIEHQGKAYAYFAETNEGETIQFGLEDILFLGVAKMEIPLQESDQELIYILPKFTNATKFAKPGKTVRADRLSHIKAGRILKRFAAIATDLCSQPARIQVEIDEFLFPDQTNMVLDEPLKQEYHDVPFLYTTSEEEAKEELSRTKQKEEQLIGYWEKAGMEEREPDQRDLMSVETVLNLIHYASLSDQELRELYQLMQEAYSTKVSLYKASEIHAMPYHTRQFEWKTTQIPALVAIREEMLQRFLRQPEQTLLAKRRFEVETPLGTLIAYAKHETDHPADFPGVYVDHVAKETPDELVLLACVEFESVDECIQTCVYGDGLSDEPTSITKHENLIVAEEEEEA